VRVPHDPSRGHLGRVKGAKILHSQNAADAAPSGFLLASLARHQSPALWVRAHTHTLEGFTYVR